MLVHLNAHFISTSLICPKNLRRIEFVSRTVKGFFIEVRSNQECCGTYYFRANNINGKMITQKIGHSSEISFSDAEMAAKKLKAELFLKISSGIDQSNTNLLKQKVPTINQYYESDYLPYIKQRNRSWKSADGIYRRYIKPVFGEIRLVDITRRMVIEFHAELKNRGLAGATADHGLKVIRHMINTAKLNEVVTDNPAARVPLFNEFNQVNNTLSSEELQRLLSILTKRNTQVCLIARMLISTACRLSEITTATWSNCNIEERVLHISSDNSKSKKARSVPLNDSAIEVLRQSNTQGKYDYLFINPKTKTRYYSVHKAWNKIRIEAGLPNLRLHDLRHFVASQLASQGESIYIISKLLGHANVVTSERYSHVTHHAQSKASDKISSVIQDAMSKVTS
jgi:integrase